ncbi:hypothetical protein bcgnr5390_12550 [Bacillus luti]|nr:hypothetical protein BC2903_51230 [Bacillus cereus]
MEWFAFSLAVVSFVLITQEMDKNKKLEKRVRELENKIKNTRISVINNKKVCFLKQTFLV